MTRVEDRWPESSHFLIFLRNVARVVTVGSCLHETVRICSQVAWYIAQSETHGFRATRRSLAALPLQLKVESTCGYFRANVSPLESHTEVALGLWIDPHGVLCSAISTQVYPARGARCLTLASPRISQVSSRCGVRELCCTKGPSGCCTVCTYCCCYLLLRVA